MKQSRLINKSIVLTILSFIFVFGLFLVTNLYTLGDIPTKLVIIRYLVVSIICSILLILLNLFVNKNRNNTYLLISVFLLIPFIIYLLFVLLINMLLNNLSGSNLGAIGLLIIFIFMIVSIPCLILSCISLKKSKDKTTKVISIIDLLLWLIVIIYETIIFI